MELKKKLESYEYYYADVLQPKRALCTSKVLELAQKGMIRETGGYYGLSSESMAMKSISLIYDEAGAEQ